VPPKARKTRKRRRRRNKWFRRNGPRGVTAAAAIALAASGARNYTVPDWYAGFYGVPGSLLRRKITPMTLEYTRARTLLVRLNYLIDRQLGVVGNANLNSLDRPLCVYRRNRLVTPTHEFFSWGTLDRVRSYLSKTLEEIVHLPLFLIREGCFPVQGPKCAGECTHVSCGPLYWSQQGRSRRKARSVELGSIAARMLQAGR